MTHSEFMSRLTMRFPALKESGARYDDIATGLKTFDEIVLDRLWDEFHATYDRDAAPRWASIATIARKAEIYRNTPGTARVAFWVYKCVVCGSYFNGNNHPDMQKCLICKKPTQAIVVKLSKNKNCFQLNQEEFGNKEGKITVADNEGFGDYSDRRMA